MIMMKWRVRRETGCNSSPDQEDIRKSLDVLDRVLAEFDDDDCGGDSWRRPPRPSSSFNGDVWHEYNGGIPNGHRRSGFDFPRSRSRYDVSSCSDSVAFVRSNSTHSFQSLPADGGTSLASSDQLRKVSPPPVPKRSPATRLSSHEDLLFSSLRGDDDDDKIAKRRSYAEGFNYSSSSPSTRHFLGFLSSPKGGEPLSARRGDSPNLCTNTAMTATPSLSNQQDCNSEIARSSSSQPSDRCQREDTMDDVEKSPTVAQRRAKFERRLVNSDLDDSFRSRSFPRSSPKRSAGRKILGHEEVAVAKATDDSGRQSDRMRLLDEKFAEVRRLIRTGQVRPLAEPPPSFMPPPPPKPPRKQRDCTKDSRRRARFPSSEDCNSLPYDTPGGPTFQDLKSLPASLRLARKIEDLPKTLPPLLGFSYSMEEDMSPGIKEILTASTPDVKGRVDASTKSNTTFNSSSVSSLGYSSSQSDLDLNNVSDLKDDKVPVDGLKSQTLPIGMKLGPDYYSDLHPNDCDSLDSYGLKNGSLGDEQQHFRSSSAPPFKLLDDDKRPSSSSAKRRIFSKKLKNKNDCNTESSAVKSKTSLDDGIILRRISNLGDEFPTPDFTVNKGEVPQEEKKRRSVWKSILRRK